VTVGNRQPGQTIITHRKSFLLFVLMLMVVMIGYLASPKVANNEQKKHYTTNVHLVGPFTVSLSRDSPVFLRLAESPKKILRRNQMRQNRPGLIFLAYLISQPLSFLSDINVLKIVRSSSPDIPQLHINSMLLKYVPQYVAYIFINILILVLAYMLFLRLVGDKGPIFLGAFAISALLILNNPVKLFIWSPHTQMFNVLIPIYLLYIFQQVSTNSLKNKSQMVGHSVLAGFGAVCYGSFILFIPALVLSWCISYFVKKEEIMMLSFKRLLGLCFLTITPFAIWVLLVKFIVGSYYSYATEHAHLFTWIVKAYNHGVVLKSLLNNLGVLVTHLYAQTYSLLGVYCLIFFFKFLYFKSSEMLLDKNIKQLIYSSVFVSLIFTVFWVLMGFLPGRLDFTVMVPWIIVAAVIFQRMLSKLLESQRCMATIIMATAILGYGLFFILKDGPHFSIMG
jgi:hypothetical protein